MVFRSYINKPKVNAIDHKMSQEIANAFSELKNDQNLKLVSFQPKEIKFSLLVGI